MSATIKQIPDYDRGFLISDYRLSEALATIDCSMALEKYDIVFDVFKIMLKFFSIFEHF